jgi:hypothetical protein
MKTLRPPSNGSHIIGLVYYFSHKGATFDPPLKLEYRYHAAELAPGVPEDDLVIVHFDDTLGKWVECQCICDPASDCVTALVNYFTSFALIASITQLSPWYLNRPQSPFHQLNPHRHQGQLRPLSL